jgi:predicted RNA binding protein YcfA (HicA-like mRNA interferase family)
MLKLLAADGWVIKTRRGSHRQLVHPTKSAKVTVAGHGGDEIPTGMEKSIHKYAELEE